MAPTANKAAPGVPFYTPAQEPAAGTPTKPGTSTATAVPPKAKTPTLFTPLKIRDVTLNNRIFVSPMCMYSADDGHLTDFHLVHLGQFALRGAGLVIVEATAVEARGRISPEDSGLWKDSQIAPLRRITDFIHSQGQHAGIQLAHAGRKASTMAPWLVAPPSGVNAAPKKELAGPEAGGWPDDVVAPSAIPYSDDYPSPRALTVEEIRGVVQAFADSARRAVEAGFDVIEIHGAHGYLITEFLSPRSNTRTDDYGGSFENRTRILREVVQAVRDVVPSGMPVFLRVSATEWMEYAGEPSWDLEATLQLVQQLPDLGVDLVDVSSGGNSNTARIDTSDKLYQVRLAGKIREAARAQGRDTPLLVGAVGLISDPEGASSIVQEAEGEEQQQQQPFADAILVARQFLRDGNFVLNAARDLGVPVKWPNQYHRAPRAKY